MIAALLALTISQQASSTVQLGTVDIGGQQVAVEVPAQRGPFDENTRHVEIDGWKFTVSPEGAIGVRYKSDGGWGEVADGYPAAAQKSVSAPEYRIKVIIFTNATILEHGHDSVWRRRRGVISENDKQTIFKSLARLKALAETAADGRVRLTFDVSYDDDMLFKTVDANNRLGLKSQSEVIHIGDAIEPNYNKVLGSNFVREDIAPRISNDAFDNEEGIYSGPYSSIFVIHPARTLDFGTDLIERTPVTTMSWATFGKSNAGAELSVQLFHSWYEHLNLAMLSFNGKLQRSIGSSYAIPKVYDFPISDLLLEQGNRIISSSLANDSAWGAIGETKFTVEDAKELNFSSLKLGQEEDFRLYAGASVVPNIGDVPSFLSGYRNEKTNIVYVPPHLAARYMTVNPQATAIGLWLNDSIDNLRAQFIGFELSIPPVGTNHLKALGLEPPPIKATQMAPMMEPSGSVSFRPAERGDFKVEFINDPVEGRVHEVTESGRFRRGYVAAVAPPEFGALFRVASDTALSFKVSCDLPDAFVLQLLTDGGKKLEIALFGKSQIPAEIINNSTIYLNHSKEPGPFWTEFKIDLPDKLAGLNITQIRVGPPDFADHYERKSGGMKTLKISQITYGPMTDTDSESVVAIDPDIDWLSNLEGPLDDNASKRVAELLQSNLIEVRLNALGAMTRIKDEAMLPHVAVLMNSIDESEAYLAVQATKLIDTDLAWSDIAFVLARGPLGHNYRFAAEALADKPEPATLQLMNGLMLNRSWRTRRAAVQTFAKINSEGAGTIAALALISDPNPIVRYEITKQSRPDHELFTRRLLYMAVNDPSEWVRGSCYLALLDSPFENYRDQALRGVRDESITIRLTLLESMKNSPQPHYRSALQFAVVDSSPFVRAAALRAFATSPGTVEAGEIQNTFTDDHPAVKQALAELVKAKNITVPTKQ